MIPTCEHYQIFSGGRNDDCGRIDSSLGILTRLGADASIPVELTVAGILNPVVVGVGKKSANFLKSPCSNEFLYSAILSKSPLIDSYIVLSQVF